jgi:hypothetical protein
VGKGETDVSQAWGGRNGWMGLCGMGYGNEISEMR